MYIFIKVYVMRPYTMIFNVNYVMQLTLKTLDINVLFVWILIFVLNVNSPSNINILLLKLNTFLKKDLKEHLYFEILKIFKY